MFAMKKDNRWLGVLYEKHYRRLVALAGNLVGDIVDPRDVVQDAFEAILAGNVLIGPGDLRKQLEDVVDFVAQTYRETGKWEADWNAGLHSADGVRVGGEVEAA